MIPYGYDEFLPVYSAMDNLYTIGFGQYFHSFYHCWFIRTENENIETDKYVEIIHLQLSEMKSYNLFLVWLITRNERKKNVEKIEKVKLKLPPDIEWRKK